MFELPNVGNDGDTCRSCRWFFRDPDNPNRGSCRKEPPRTYPMPHVNAITSKTDMGQITLYPAIHSDDPGCSYHTSRGA